MQRSLAVKEEGRLAQEMKDKGYTNLEPVRPLGPLAC